MLFFKPMSIDKDWCILYDKSALFNRLSIIQTNVLVVLVSRYILSKENYIFSFITVAIALLLSQQNYVKNPTSNQLRVVWKKILFMCRIFPVSLFQKCKIKVLFF